MDKHVLNVEIALNLGISLDEYFLLYCIANNAENLLIQYVEKNPIKNELFTKLIDKDFIVLNSKTDKIYFNDVKITEKGKLAIGSNKVVNEGDFDEFRKNYPNQVKFMTPTGLAVRKLQGNLPRCKALYIKMLKKVSHEQLCRCAKLYWEETAKNEGGRYVKMLQVWLHEELFVDYLEDIQQTVKKDQSDDI